MNDSNRPTLRHPLARGRRRFLIGTAAAVASVGIRAEGTTPRKAGADKHWRMLINEAYTGDSNLFILTSRYRPLAEYLSSQLRSRPTIEVEPVVNVHRFIELAQHAAQPELVFGKTVNQLAKLVRDHGYQPVARRADPYKAAFIVASSSPIRTLADASQRRAKIIMPDEMAATTAVAKAELRRLKADQVQVVHTRYQEAVAQQVSGGFAEVGVVNPTVARKWAQDGGRVLGETQPVVNWSVLAAPSLPDAEVTQLRAAFLAMNSQASLMGSLGIKEWASADKQQYLALLDYTKE